jgi:inner membrane protein
MEPVTHFLTGTCIGRAGLNRKTAYATIAATLAAEAPDIDILWSLRGPVESLKHHRGITHTFLAAPVIAAVVVAVIALWHVARKRKRAPAVPVRWAWLYATALIAALSHILLDWTNNYGVRPFFPFNPRWYAGSIWFIAEPVVWALLAIALIMPAILGITDREIGARRQPFRGRGWAIFALTGMLALGLWRSYEQSRARQLLAQQPLTTAPVLRIGLEPYPVDPWHWHAIVETPSYYQFAEINTRTESVDSDSKADVLYKPGITPAVEAAKRTSLGQVYLDWGTWAVVRDLGQSPVPGIDPPHLPPGRTWTTVEFTDLRFAYAFRPGGDSRAPSALSGWAYIVDGRDEAAEGMGNREQK